ncbi:hypothetical protein AWJ20_2188 [Sugiyamaella lignohabitans]|uniref:Uncharacterized protein n=1 Tax=Sugiyamaella lignohabitans TaxID=796027 RepID=A0A167EXV5_9ASCO|nr:uncharacterized protein AWJ20_2188 [Sugiyamaella lignohabitans]ANB14588.1 hypothetical protein AWJ20_2188 [Sugiyamaella lignohabitans]
MSMYIWSHISHVRVSANNYAGQQPSVTPGYPNYASSGTVPQQPAAATSSVASVPAPATAPVNQGVPSVPAVPQQATETASAVPAVPAVSTQTPAASNSVPAAATAPSVSSNNGGDASVQGTHAGRGDSGASSRPKHNNRNGQGQKPKVVLPEFNFDASNAKFSKEDITKEESVIPKAPAEGFYDKKSSFFDNISSTTKEQIEGSSDNKTAYQRRGEERQLNMETFGQAESNHGNWRGGRGGRGRGRGGHRGRGNGNWRGGRGGFNNNNNNSNNFS